jgi:hypothetical protein
MKTPLNWPEDYIYTSRSFCGQMHPNLFASFLPSSPQGEEGLGLLVKKGEVHSSIQMRRITPHLKYRGHGPHPLAHTKYGKRAQLGVFATHAIDSEVELGEYVGELTILAQDWKAHFKDSDHAWTLDLGPFVVLVNAKKYANELAFINDYRGLSQESNVKAKWVAFDESFHVVFMTKRAIQKEEELLLDYGEAYWQAASRHSLLPK